VLASEATSPASTAGVASSWLIPIAPTTLPEIDAGTDSCLAASLTVLPATLYSLRLVANACSTWAAVPDAAIVMRSADTAPTLKPSLRSQFRAAFTSLAVGENSDSHLAAVT
jgi:hypothetical protein